MARAIKPCPYCGGEAKVRRVGRWKQRFSVFCSRCYKSTIPGSAWKLTKRGAIREWNSRWLPMLQSQQSGCRTVRSSRPVAHNLLEQVLYDIKHIPDVDAEPVVHCSDCLYLMFSDCYGECKRGYLGGVVRPDDYCSRGERKEDNT